MNTLSLRNLRSLQVEAIFCTEIPLPQRMITTKVQKEFFVPLAPFVAKNQMTGFINRKHIQNAAFRLVYNPHT